MSDQLFVDVPTIRIAASKLRTAAGKVPVGSPVDVSGCGSSAVIAAADAFNLWATVTGQITAAKLTGSSVDADNAATAFETLEAELAAGVQP